VVYFLSGGPFWDAKSCKEMNITRENENRRPPLTAEEKTLLSSSVSQTAVTNNLLNGMEFLQDHQTKDSIYQRFERYAPMAQVVISCL
jgi:hypothetical protein